MTQNQKEVTFPEKKLNCGHAATQGGSCYTHISVHLSSHISKVLAKQNKLRFLSYSLFEVVLTSTLRMLFFSNNLRSGHNGHTLAQDY